MRFDLTKKIGLLIGFFLIIIVLWYILLYIPKVNELKRIKDEINRFQMQYKILSQNNSPAVLDKAEETTIFTKYNELIAQLPKKEDISSALNQIKRIGQEGKIKILSLKLLKLQLLENSNLKREYQIEEIPVNVIVQGDFFDIVQYLLHLGNLPFMSRFKNIRIETYEKIYPEIETRFTCMLFIVK